MIIARVHNYDEYLAFQKNAETKFHNIWLKEKAMVPAKRGDFSVRGISYPAREIVNFHVDFEYSDGVNINWRERLVCPKTNLNNRLRACIHFAEFELGIQDYHSLYLTEQITPLYKYFLKAVPSMIGSEYLGPDIAGGTMVKGIHHEDMTQLSFDTGTFDFYLSFECFEHIPDFKKAFSEAFRVLKTQGSLFFSVPFAYNSDKNIIRAYIDDSGETVHLHQPEYHGDPVKEGGVLCYTHFGWQMLDELREIGFNEVYALIYWSDDFGYLGGQQILFVAKK